MLKVNIIFTFRREDNTFHNSVKTSGLRSFQKSFYTTRNGVEYNI